MIILVVLSEDPVLIFSQATPHEVVDADLLHLIKRGVNDIIKNYTDHLFFKIMRSACQMWNYCCLLLIRKYVTTTSPDFQAKIIVNWKVMIDQITCTSLLLPPNTEH